MPRKPPADQPHFAVPKIEGQPWHEDPEIMARVTRLTDLNTTAQTDAAAPSAAAIFGPDAEWENMTVEQRAIKVFGAEMAGQLAASPLSTHDINTLAENARAEAINATAEIVSEMDGQDEWIRANAPIPETALEDNLYEGANNQVKARHGIDEKTTTDFSVTGGWNDRTPSTTDDHTTNPYLLESSTILGELAYEAVRARAVIQQLDAEIDHLNQDAAFQIRRIEARRDIELEQRNRRKDDLMKIVSADIMLNGEKQGSDQ